MVVKGCGVSFEFGRFEMYVAHTMVIERSNAQSRGRMDDAVFVVRVLGDCFVLREQEGMGKGGGC